MLYGLHWCFIQLAYSYSEISSSPNWSESLLNDLASKLSFFHDGENTHSKIIISCHVLDSVSGLSGSSAVGNQDNRWICGLSTVLVAGAKKVSAEREDVLSCVEVTTSDKKFRNNSVANASNIDALNPSNYAIFRVPLSHKMLYGPDDVTLTLLNDGANLRKGDRTV